MTKYPLAEAFSIDCLEAGCDEAGRGCLAGPVVAAAVILPRGFFHPLIRDSKSLSPGQRKAAREIIEKNAVSFATAMVEPEVIDRVNILRASLMAMHKALEQLVPQPEMILVDGNQFIPYKNIPHQCIVRADQKYLSVAAASILAKTCRDHYMETIHDSHPQYGWADNKGYPTPGHRKALQIHGPTSLHRFSFRGTGKDFLLGI